MHLSNAVHTAYSQLSVASLLILSLLVLCGSASPADQRQLSRLVRRGQLHLEHQDSPSSALELRRHLAQRQVASSATAVSSVTSVSVSSNATVATSTTTTSSVTGLDTAPTTEATVLPLTFDSNIGSNFTAPACQDFFNALKSNTAFQQCYPLSLLLTNSLSFFHAEKSFFAVTYALDATCSANYQQCSNLMSGLAQKLQGSSVCGPDLTAENPLVQQTYSGLLAYPVVYQAGCLKDSMGNYCFATAVTNVTTASNAYPYYLPIGTPLPSPIAPTCDQCLKNTMTVLANSAGNSTQPISKTYGDAAKVVDAVCGNDFVPITAAKGAGVSSRGGADTSVVLLGSFVLGLSLLVAGL